jgi:two-component system response regulator
MSSNGAEIFLVEDNPNDVELTLDASEHNQVSDHVYVVRDGAEALEFHFCSGRYANRRIENSPKVVRLYLKLPKVDGLEGRRRVKGDARTRRIQVVVLTASREESDLVESYDLGVKSYIIKPVDLQQFNEAVRTRGLCWMLNNQRPGP